MFSPTKVMLDSLYGDVAGRMSPKRFAHTAAVADMVARLSELYCPKKKDMLTAAALLHDLTKEWDKATHEAFILSHGESITETERLAPKTHHARTAVLLIPEQYPDFSDEELLSCVRYHTTGRADMTLEEKLVYLADYIDDTRTFPDCVTLRAAFWDADPQNMTHENRLAHLNNVMILSFDMTVRSLVEEGAPVHPDTVNARNDLLVKKALR